MISWPRSSSLPLRKKSLSAFRSSFFLVLSVSAEWDVAAGVFRFWWLRNREIPLPLLQYQWCCTPWFTVIGDSDCFCLREALQISEHTQCRV